MSGKAREQNYFLGGLSHDWVSYYEQRIESDRSCLNEWHAMDNLESKRPPSPDSVRTKWVRSLLSRSFRERRKKSRQQDDYSNTICNSIAWFFCWSWHSTNCIQKSSASRKMPSRREISRMFDFNAPDTCYTPLEQNRFAQYIRRPEKQLAIANLAWYRARIG